MGSIIITPAKPISSLDVYCLLRDGHTGTAWFDNVQIYSISPLSFGSASVQVLCILFHVLFSRNLRILSATLLRYPVRTIST